MDEAEYKMVQGNLVQLAVMVDRLDLDGFLDAIGRAETVAPMIDPTLWIKGPRQLLNVKNLARGFQAVQIEFRRQLAEEGG